MTLDAPRSRWLGQRPTLSRWAWAIHLAVIAGLLGWLILTWATNQPPALAPTCKSIPVWAAIVWIIGYLAMIAAPLWPALTLVILGLLATLIARYEPGIDIELNAQVIQGLAIAGVTATLVWMARMNARWRWPSWRNWPFWILPMLIGWIGICGMAAWIRLGDWTPDPTHHPIQFVSILIFFLLACRFLDTPISNLAFGLTMIAALAVRGRFLSPFGIFKQEDIASLLVITLPLSLLVFSCWPGRCRSWRWPAVGLVMLLAAHHLWLWWNTQNRASAVALGLVLLTLWALSRHRIVSGIVSLGAMLAGAAAIAQTAYWQRFQALGSSHAPHETGSATERLEIWQAAWKMLMDHPVLGVGPGHFTRFVLDYNPNLRRNLPAHNHLLAMLAETGWIGGLLFVLFFGSAILLLIRTLRICPTDWPAPAVKCLMAAIVAYLAVGCFITRHDLILAYVLAGWAVALHGHLAERDLLVSAGES